MKDDDDDGEESGNITRYPCLPSLIALQQMRNRLHMAHDGKRLMKWSALASGRELRRVAKEISLIYASFTEDVRNAFIILARCRYFYPNLNKMVLESIGKKACVTVGRSSKSVAGCKLTTYDIEDVCPDSYPCLGIDRGGDVIDEAKRLWHDLLKRMISIQQLRSNFVSLDISHQNANKKSNVLGKIIIPRTDKTIRYILSELEELEREEFFRLKKVLEVKYRHKKKKKAEEKAPPPPPPKQKPPAPQPVVSTPEPVVSTPQPVKVESVPSEPVKVESVPSQPPSKKPSKLKVTIPSDACMFCERPLHEGKPLTEEQIQQEKAALAELNEKLGLVVDATDEYAKTASDQDVFQEFKKTTLTLREKLQTASLKSIVSPEKVDVNKLCDHCKELFNKESQKQAKCIVCGELIAGKVDAIPAEAKESKKNLERQLDTVLNAIKDYESQGLADGRITQFKQTAAELKEKLEGPPIPPGVDVTKLCNACKLRLDGLNEPESTKDPKNKESKVSIKEPSPETSRVSTTSERRDDLALGVFETEEITEVIQVRNPDGTVTEKRRVITIVRKPGQGTSRGQSNNTFSDTKNVRCVSILPKKKLMYRLPRVVQSDYSLSSDPMSDRVVRECISSSFEFGFEEILENVTELCEGIKESSHVVVIAASFDTLNGTDASVKLEISEPKEH